MFAALSGVAWGPFTTSSFSASTSGASTSAASTSVPSTAATSTSGTGFRSSAQQSDETAPLARGKKLFLKDGDFQLVREYQVEGNKVRFYSVERSQWEEIPADMVDWDATHKAEATESQRDTALLNKVHADEAARKAVVVDIDASVEVAPNVFLPDGEGLFVLDGTRVSALAQAETDYKFSKGQLAKQILIPIPIIPTRHTVSINGTRANFRITNKEVEFYRRSKDAMQPEIFLIHAKVKGGRRQIENLDQLFHMQTAKRETVSMENWELVKGVYRFTLSQELAPGEYVMAEVVKGTGEDQELYVWDFGVDKASKAGN